MDFISQINKDFEKLRSAGFKWEEDAIKGMIVQLCSPTSGEYRMDILNNTLDARYCNDKTPFSLLEIRSTYQSQMTTRRTVNKSEETVRALATSFQKMTPYKSNSNCQMPYSPSPSSSQTHYPQNQKIQPPAAFFKTVEEQEKSVALPVVPTMKSAKEVHDGIWQCFHCAKFGHGKISCGSYKRGQGRTAPHFNNWLKCLNGVFYTRQALFGSPPQPASTTPITARHAQVEATPSPTPLTVSASTVAWSAEGNAEDEVPTEYLLDGGATHHVSNARGSLIGYCPLSQPIKLKTAANGENTFIVGKGSLRITNNVVVTDVYCSPQALCTLISQAKLVEQGARLWFWGNDVIIRLPDGNSVIAMYRDRKWVIDAITKSLHLDDIPDIVGRVHAMSASKDVDLAYLWHRRFGHVDMKRIRKLCVGQLGLGLPQSIPTATFTCEDCLLCKITRQRKLGRSERDLGMLDVVVSDVMGPFPSDVNGNRFTVAFRDVATTYSDIVIIKNKSDVSDEFTKVINRWERETGFKVKNVRTDGGGEYVKTTFSTWLKAKGILHENSNPYKPEQNGVAERLNRTISEMGRTMLAASHLPQDFWSFPYVTACYLHNRLPNTLTGNKTPYELFYGRKPQLDIVRTFGSTAFVHRHKAQRHGKLDERGSRCTMIG